MELKFVNTITWEEVFSIWEKGESALPHWIAHYTKRGFSSWRDWRSNTVGELHPEQLSWSLYEIIDPLSTVPKFHAGPFRAWIKKYYGGNATVPFGMLAQHPEIQADMNIQAIIDAFPDGSMLVGLKTPEGVIIIEGLHRCAALAVANNLGRAINTKLFIACAEFAGTLPLLGQENSPT